MHASLNQKTHLKLQPKADGTATLENFKPTSFYNCEHKFCSTYWLRGLNESRAITNANHYAYIEQRNFHQAISCAQLKNVYEPNTIISLDFSREFDHVDRKFLPQPLKNVGLPGKLISILQEFYRKTKASLVVTGYSTSELRIERGVKQGCPFSAVLSILFPESLLVRLKLSKKLLKLSKKSFAYANDVTTFIQGFEVDSLVSVVEHFCAGT